MVEDILLRLVPDMFIFIGLGWTLICLGSTLVVIYWGLLKLKNTILQ
ncbi:MAG: hypothetical protein GY718_18065 [Lentisphaerae bacterium]|nr:hypothetical protein [Lentisphaerota bacterium]